MKWEAYTIGPAKGTPEWFAARQHVIGSSVSPSILLDGPEAPGYCSVYSAFQDYVLGVKEAPTERMSAGNFLQEGIAIWVAHELAADRVETYERLIVSSSHPFLGATPDAHIWINGQRFKLEIKNTDQPQGWGDDDRGPAYGWIQCQHIMMVADEDEMVLGGCLFGNRLSIKIVQRDERFISGLLRPACEEFWECVQSARDPSVPTRYPDPDASARTRKALSAMFPAPDPEKIIELPAELVHADEAYPEIERLYKENGSKRDKIRNAVKLALLKEGASKATTAGSIWSLGGIGLRRKEIP